jgi:hypothetical protein
VACVSRARQLSAARLPTHAPARFGVRSRALPQGPRCASPVAQSARGHTTQPAPERMHGALHRLQRNARQPASERRHGAVTVRGFSRDGAC